jgi:DHA2 family multidrug resistance protein-like MFS transporter
LAVLALPTFLVSIDLFVLLLALPTLSKDIGATSTEQLWIMDMYGFLMAGFLVTMGSLGDRIGRRKLLLIGAAWFGIVSLIAAHSTSPGMLIAMRALMGISGATLMPSTLALIFNMFHDPKQRAKAIGMWGGTFTLGAIVGPLIGGALLTHFWWGSVFLLAAPVMLALIVLGPIVLPEYKHQGAGRLDPPSVVLSLATMLPIIYGIKQLALRGFQPLPVIAVVVGVVCGVTFGRRQLKLADPILDLRLFKIPSATTPLISQLAYSVTGGGVMLLMMQYFELVRGMSPLRAGLAMVPGMASATLGFMVITPWLAARIRPAYVIAVGMTGVAIVLAVFTQIGATSGTATLIIGFAFLSICGAPLVALGTGMIISAAPPERAASAGSMAQLSNEFGGTLGVALLGTVGFAIYRHQMAHAVPAGLPASAAAGARDNLADASTAAAHAPQPAATELLARAHDAYATGIHTVAGIGAILLFGVAVLIAVRLRHIPPIGKAEPGEPPAAQAEETEEAAAA